MSALKTMLQYGGASGTANVDSMVVYATNVDVQENGGCCCLWTAPAGVTWVSVEMWGGGGGGAGNCCCHFGTSGGAGSYSRKIVDVTAGQAYRFCAAGSTYCSNDRHTGCVGYPTYLYGETEAINMACASGGKVGCNFCWGAIGTTYMGCASYQCGSYCGGMGMCGATGAHKGTAFCSGTAWTWAPTPAFTGDFYRPGRDACSGYCCGCGTMGYAHFPGSGGATSSSHNSFHGCGAAGAGGLIIVNWQLET